MINQMNLATWFIDVIQNSNYEVNSLGVVRNKKTKKVISQQRCRKGYWSVKLQGVRTRIHRIVLASFCKNNRRDMTVNHKDGVKDNNSIENLEWMTNAENIKHSAMIGLRNYNKEESHPNFKITKEVALKVLELKADGHSNPQIGQIMGLSRGAVWRVVRGRHFSCKGCTRLHQKAA